MTSVFITFCQGARPATRPSVSLPQPYVRSCPLGVAGAPGCWLARLDSWAGRRQARAELALLWPGASLGSG
jgi:hypothetical protein